MQWMNDFKIALIEEDVSRIASLLQSQPTLDDPALAKEMLALIQNALHLVKAEQKETLNTMLKIKQTKAFLLSDEASKARFIG